MSLSEFPICFVAAALELFRFFFKVQSGLQPCGWDFFARTTILFVVTGAALFVDDKLNFHGRLQGTWLIHMESGLMITPIVILRSVRETPRIFLIRDICL